MVFPKNFETLQGLMDEHMEMHKKIFADGVETSVIVIGYAKDERHVIPVRFNGHHEKEMNFKVITILFALKNVTRYTISAEAYTLSGEGAQEEIDRLRKAGLTFDKSPMAVEILTTIAVSRDDVKSVTYEVLKNRELKKQEYKDAAKMTGRMTELLPRKNAGVIHPELRKLMEMALSMSTIKVTKEMF